MAILHSSSANQLLFFLRQVQQNSLFLTGFVATYFVGWHIVLRDPVPLALVPIIAACIIVLLENYISSAVAVYHRDARPAYSPLLQFHIVCSLLMTIGYYALRRVPFVSEWCAGDNWFKPTRTSNGYKLDPAGIEEHHCALTCTIIVSGAVALASTLSITAFLATGYLAEKKPWKKGFAVRTGGYAAVDEVADDCSLFSDDTMTVVDDTEK